MSKEYKHIKISLTDYVLLFNHFLKDFDPKIDLKLEETNFTSKDYEDFEKEFVEEYNNFINNKIDHD